MSTNITLSTLISGYQTYQTDINGAVDSLQAYCNTVNAGISGLQQLSQIPVIGSVIGGGSSQLQQYAALSVAIAQGVEASLNALESATNTAALQDSLAGALNFGFDSVWGELTGQSTSLHPFHVSIGTNQGVEITFSNGADWNWSTSGAANLGLGNLIGGVSGSDSLSLGAVLAGSLTAGFNTNTLTNTDEFYVNKSGTNLSLNVGGTLGGSLSAYMGLVSVTGSSSDSNPSWANEQVGMSLTGGTASGNYIYFNDLASASPTLYASPLKYKADLSLTGSASSGYAAIMPSINTELLVSNLASLGGSNSAPTVQFLNASLNVGSYFSGFVANLLGNIKTVNSYIQPITSVLVTPISLLSSVGAPSTPLAIAEAAGYVSPSVGNFISEIAQISNVIAAIPVNANGLYNLGSYTLSGNNVLTNSAAYTSSASTLAPSSTYSGGTSGSAITNFNTLTAQSTNGGWSFPLFANPVSSALDLLTGQDVNLLEYTLPSFSLSAGYSKSFNIYGPLAVQVGANFNASAGLSVGYDTTGIAKYINQVQHGVDNPSVLFDGLYVTGMNGTPTLASLTSGFTVGGALNLVVASLSAGGGINFGASLNLIPSKTLDGQQIEYIPNITSQNFSNSFFIAGDITAYAYASCTVGWPPFGATWTWDSPAVTLWSASTEAPAAPPVILGAFNGSNLDLNTGTNYAANNINGYQNPDSLINGNYFPENVQIYGTGDSLGVVLTIPVSSGSNPSSSYSGYYNTPGGIVLNLGDGSNKFVSATNVTSNINLTVGLGNNQIQALGSGNDFIQVGNGENLIQAGTGSNTLVGGTGADTFILGGRNQSVVGGSLNPGNFVSFQNLPSSLGAVGMNLLTGSMWGGASGDVFSDINYFMGSSLNNTMAGNSNPTTLYGQRGNDCLVGHSGYDYLEGEAGKNTLIGAAGTHNTAAFETSTLPVNVDLRAGTAVSTTNSAYINDTLVNIQNVIGSSAQYAGGILINSSSGAYSPGISTVVGGTLSGSTLVGASILFANGNTLSDTTTGSGTYNTSLWGGDDYIAGTSGNNSLFGGGGLIGDTLVTYTGVDFINATGGFVPSGGLWIGNPLAVIDWSQSTVTSASTLSLSSTGSINGADTPSSSGGDSLWGAGISYINFTAPQGGSSVQLGNTLGFDTVTGSGTSSDYIIVVNAGSNNSLSGGFTGGTFVSPSLNNILNAANDTIRANPLQEGTLNGDRVAGIATLIGGNSLVAANFSQLSTGYNLIDSGGAMAAVTTPGGTQEQGFDFIGNAVLGSGNDTVNFNNVRANHNVWTADGNDTVNTGYGQVYADGGTGSNLLQINWTNENTLTGSLTPGMTFLGSFDTVAGTQTVAGGGTLDAQNGHGTATAYYGSSTLNKDQDNFLNFQQLSITGSAAADSISLSAASGWGTSTLSGGPAGNDTITGGYYSTDSLVGGSGNVSMSGGFTGGNFASPNLNNILGASFDTVLGGAALGTLTTVTSGISTLYGGNSLVAANFSQLTSGYNLTDNGADMAIVTTAGGTQLMPISLAGGSNTLSGLDFIGNAVLGSGNDTVNFNNVRANHNIWTADGNDTVNTGYGQVFADGGMGTNLLQINWANENTLTGSLTPGMTFLGSFDTVAGTQTVAGGGTLDAQNGHGTATAYYGSSTLNQDQVNFLNFQQLSITGSAAADSISLSAASGWGSSTLSGGPAGNDTITGGYYSTDSLVGGSDNVSMSGGFTGGNFASPNLNNILGASFDTVLGGAALGTLTTVTSGISTLYGGNSLVAANFSQLTSGYNLTDNGADMAIVTTAGGTQLMPISLAGGSNTLSGLDFIGNAVLGSGNDTVNFNNVRANHNVWTADGNDTVNTGFGQVYADGGTGSNLLQINWANENTLTGSLTPGMNFLGSFATMSSSQTITGGGMGDYQGASGTVTSYYGSSTLNQDQISFVNFQKLSLIGTGAADFISLSSATTSTVNGMGSSLNGFSTLNGGSAGNDTIIGGYYSADSLVGGSGSVSLSGGFTGGTTTAPSLSNILLAANDTVLTGTALGTLTPINGGAPIVGGTLPATSAIYTLSGGNSLVAANFSQLTSGYNLTDNGADMAIVTTAGGTQLMPISLAGGSNTLSGLDFIGNAVLGSGNDTVNFNNIRANHNVWTGAGNDTVNTGFGQVYADGGTGTNLLQINWANENTLNGAMPSGMTLNGSFDTTTGGAIPSVGGTYNSLNGNGSAIGYFGSLMGNKDQVNFLNFQQASITGTSANDYLAMIANNGWGAATLNGGSAGNDTIIGGHDSSDSLIGGSGNVLFNPGFTGTSTQGPNLTDILSAKNDTIVSGSALGTLKAVNGGSTIVGGTLSPTSAVYTLSGGNTLMAANFTQLTVPYTLNGNGSDLAAVTSAGGTRILPIGGSGSLSGIDFIGSVALGTPTTPGAGNTINFANIRAPHNVWTGGGNDTITAGFGNEYLDGQAGTNLLQINWQNENLSTGSLTPGMTFIGTFMTTPGGTMTGGGTFDSLDGQGMATAYYGPNGSSIDQTNFVNMQQFNITGTAGNNFMQVIATNGWGASTLNAGGGGNNTLIGGRDSRDMLIGGSGNDSISGGPLDTMNGGGGTNTYVVTSTSNRISDTGVKSVIQSSVSFNLASSLVSGVNNLVYTGLSAATLIGNSAANSLSASRGNDTFQGWNGTAASNTTNDTLIGSSGADLFVMANAGDTNNAYGNGHSNTAVIQNFSTKTGDIVQLHDFGGSHAGSSGYSTVSGGSGIIDIYSYLGSSVANEVAVINISSGTFSWAKNAKFV